MNMPTTQPLILIIGAADTGRAPMAVALLQRLLDRRGYTWIVESAGVVGHDEDPAEKEARDAMSALNFNITSHVARSLTDELAAQATLLLAIDSGIARVLRGKYPEAKIISLGELAGRQRDIPDPFRMQVGAWISYAREMESMLQQGLERLRGLVVTEPAAQNLPDSEQGQAAPALSDAAQAALARALRLLSLLEDMPGVVDWAQAQQQLRSDLASVQQEFPTTAPQAASLASMLSWLERATSIPPIQDLAQLRTALYRLKP